jgi:GNAT superfamily N-acetyltransferase
MPPLSELPGDLEAVDLAHAPLTECLSLSAEAGWNQVEADWRRLLHLGRGFGLAERGGPLIASAMVLPYDSSIAWISMVLVTARWRRRGLASRLLRQALDTCQAIGRTAFLDATPEGAEVYRRLGFTAGETITRWSRPGGDDAEFLPPSDNDACWEQSCRRDAHAMGAPRRALLDALRIDGRCLLRPVGSLLLRPGRLAWQIGPLVAEDRRGAEDLLSEGLTATGTQPAFADARDAAGLADVLQAARFKPQRRFLRMHLGTPPPDDPPLLWLTAGPEFG